MALSIDVPWGRPGLKAIVREKGSRQGWRRKVARRTHPGAHGKFSDRAVERRKDYAQDRVTMSTDAARNIETGCVIVE